MPDFRSDEEMRAFLMMFSEDKGLDYLDAKLARTTEEQQQRYLDRLRRLRAESGRKNA